MILILFSPVLLAFSLVEPTCVGARTENTPGFLGWSAAGAPFWFWDSWGGAVENEAVTLCLYLEEGLG